MTPRRNRAMVGVVVTLAVLMLGGLVFYGTNPTWHWQKAPQGQMNSPNGEGTPNPTR